MACHSELAYNQSLQVLELYTSPLAGLEEQLQHSIAKLEGLKEIYEDPVGTVVDIINQTANAVEQIKNELVEYEEVDTQGRPNYSEEKSEYRKQKYRFQKL